jgi:hypothetical protein
MLRLALEPTEEYDFSSLNECQIISQETLYLLTLLYIYHYILCLMVIVSFFAINFITFVLSTFRSSLFVENYLLI